MKPFINICRLLAVLSSLLIFGGQVTSASKFSSITTRNGLCNRHVMEATEDDNGYVWFATRGGIDRYNGEKMAHYPLVEPSGNIDEHIKGVASENNGRVLAFSEKYIYQYSDDADAFIIDSLSVSNKIAGAYNSVIPSGKDLWIATTDGLWYISPDKDIKQVKGLEEASVYAVAFDTPYHGWVATAKGLFSLSQNEKGMLVADKEDSFEPLNNKRIQSLLFDSQTHLLWIGTYDSGVYRWKADSNSLTIPNNNIRRKPVRSLAFVGTNSVWAGIDGEGIFEFNRFDGQIVSKYAQGASNGQSLLANSIYHILEGKKTKKIWISTYTSGVMAFNENSIATKLYATSEMYRTPDSDNNINCVAEDEKGRIWMGTNNGLYRYDPSSNRWASFLQNDSRFPAVILSLYIEPDGNVWVGGYSREVVIIDKNDNVKTVVFSNEKSPLSQKRHIYAITSDNQGNIWLGGIIDNLLCYNRKTATAQEFPVKGINQIIYCRPDSLLIATNHGVVALNPMTGKNHLCTNPALQANVRQILVNPGYPDDLWLGTYGKGVIRHNLKTGQTHVYSQSEGLSANTVSGLEMDHLGRIWISTEHGINCMIPSTGQIESFFESDGIPSDIMNNRAHAKMSNNHILWGTDKGVFELNPDKYEWKNEKQFNLHFEEFALFNSAVTPAQNKSPLQTTIDKTEKIKLSHDQNSFSFRFLNVGNSKDLYSWFLEGFDNDWSKPSESHHATYTNIPPGKYYFRVRVFNGSDPDNYAERSIKIIVEKPWWWSWYMILFYICACMGIVYLFVRLYKRRLEIIDSDQKIRFFVNVAHDIRTPLTLIKAPLSELAKQTTFDSNSKESLDLALRNTDKLLNMVSQLLDFQKMERQAMKLHVEQTDIPKFINSIVNSFIPLASIKQISINCDVTIKEENAKGYIDQHNVSVILDNLLSNAVKYTNKHGNIWVKAAIQKGILKIEIADDGIGISQTDQKKLFKRFFRGENAYSSKETGSGIGMLMIRKMVTLHKGEISFSSKEGIGSTFIVSIPVERNSYSDTELLKKTIDVKETMIENEPTSDSEKPIMMIVEDNDELRGYLARQLSLDYNMVEAENGRDALDIIRNHQPDFIVSDILMPELSGTDLCRKLKSDICTCHIPVILLTSLSDRQDIINGLNTGADDYITKPFDLTLLKAKIANIIQNRQRFKKKFIDKSAFSDSVAGLSELDNNFMKKVVEWIENHLQEDFSVDELASEMAMSRSAFFKKIKSLTANNPQDFIRDIRMKKAATLLTLDKYPINEVAYILGFSNPKYFSTAFKKYYGKTPSEYISIFNSHK